MTQEIMKEQALKEMKGHDRSDCDCDSDSTLFRGK